MSEFQRATGLDVDTLRLLILLLKEVYEHEGRWLSATELRSLMLRPGS